MAKKRERESIGKPKASGAVEKVVLDVAEDLGRLLGTAQAKASDWLGHRDKVTTQLVDLRDNASKMLAQLGHQVAASVQSVTGTGGTQKARAKNAKKKTARRVPAPPGTGQTSKHAAKRGPAKGAGSGTRATATAARQRRTQRKPG